MNELRTVDIFDGNTGEMVCQLYDPNASGIISVSWALQLKVLLSIEMQPREVLGIRTTGVSALLVTDSCSHGVMTAG